jgi:uncharacterized protein (DUF2141 family)
MTAPFSPPTLLSPLATGFGLLLLLLLIPGPARAAGAPITVVIWNIRYPEGSVHVDVCTRATFLKSSCPFSASAPARIGETKVVVPDVPPGDYAIQAFHDFKNTGTLEQGAFGIPREGIAFSRDPPLGLHGPSFDRARFAHGDEPQTLRLRLHHFKPPPPSSHGPP